MFKGNPLEKSIEIKMDSVKTKGKVFSSLLEIYRKPFVNSKLHSAKSKGNVLEIPCKSKEMITKGNPLDIHLEIMQDSVKTKFWTNPGFMPNFG